MGLVNRFEIYLATLDPTVGSEYQKTRPCLIVSPDTMNHKLKTVILAPMTSRQRPYPTRIKSYFQKQEGDIVLEQLRTVDKKRLVRKLGVLDDETSFRVKDMLVEMFS